MAVYHFTVHAHQSWMPDRRRGYVKDRKILQPSREVAERYRNNADQPPVEFDERQLRMMFSALYDICRRRGWKLFAYGSDPSHVHFVVGWREYIPALDARNKIVNLLSKFLGDLADERGRRWFARRPSRKRVRDRRHLKHLIEEYLPKHRGVFWKDGDPLPPPLEHWLGKRS